MRVVSFRTTPPFYLPSLSRGKSQKTRGVFGVVLELGFFGGSGYCCLKRSGVVGHRWGEVPICRMILVQWDELED